MSALSAGMTREDAFELLAAHNKDSFHIEHGETVEQTMRYFAREYDPENEEFWGIVGLLHDLDWEEHDDEPEKHTLFAAPLIEEAGGTPELIRAIQSHTSDFNPDLPKPRGHRERRGDARLGIGRAVRPHHRGHAVLRSRPRHLRRRVGASRRRLLTFARRLL